MDVLVSIALTTPRKNGKKSWRAVVIATPR